MQQFYIFYMKRLFDLFFALVGLITLLPLLLILIIIIKIVSPNAPAVYGHKRLGKNGKIFTCWKLRTMIPYADIELTKILQAEPALAEEFAKTQKLKDDPRIIRGIGHFLRRSSMDELPQFFNVLMGEMSIIGPRPITEAELIHYGQHKDLFLSIKPGISGLWQTSGRNDVTYNQRIELDLFYIENISLFLDLRIALKTIFTIIRGSGY